MKNKEQKLSVVFGVIFLASGIWILTSASYYSFNDIFMILAGGFLCLIGCLLIIQPFLHIKVFKHLQKILIFPIILFAYVAHFYKLLFIVLGCVFIFLLLPNLFINLVYDMGYISKYAELDLIYISLVTGFFLFTYLGQNIISKLFDKLLDSEIVQNVTLKLLKLYVMRIIAYVLLITVYILVNLETFIKVEIMTWSLLTDVKIVLKKVLLTFVSIDILVLTISKFKENA